MDVSLILQNIQKSIRFSFEIIVKNSDDILILKKNKEENSDALQVLEHKIDLISPKIESTE